MFELSLFDQLRLTFGHIVGRHRAHAHIAQARARWSRVLRGAQGLLMLGVLVASVAAASGRGSGYVVATAVLSGLSLATLIFQLAFDIEASARAHAASAARLWEMRERYQAVLSDLCDGAIDASLARQRRDDLVSAAREIFEHAPLPEPQAYPPPDRADAADEPTLADETIDLFLPKSLHLKKSEV